jgi:hypothetical protein
MTHDEELMILMEDEDWEITLPWWLGVWSFLAPTNEEKRQVAIEHSRSGWTLNFVDDKCLRKQSRGGYSITISKGVADKADELLEWMRGQSRLQATLAKYPEYKPDDDAAVAGSHDSTRGMTGAEAGGRKSLYGWVASWEGWEIMGVVAPILVAVIATTLVVAGIMVLANWLGA